MRLALACGLIDFEQALNAIPPRILDGWLAFDRLTGAISGGDADHRQAVTTSLILSAWSDAAPDSVDVLRILGNQSFRDVTSEARDRAADEQASERRQAEREVAKIPRHPNLR